MPPWLKKVRSSAARKALIKRRREFAIGELHAPLAREDLHRIAVAVADIGGQLGLIMEQALRRGQAAREHQPEQEIQNEGGGEEQDEDLSPPAPPEPAHEPVGPGEDAHQPAVRRGGATASRPESPAAPSKDDTLAGRFRTHCRAGLAEAWREVKRARGDGAPKRRERLRCRESRSATAARNALRPRGACPRRSRGGLRWR